MQKLYQPPGDGSDVGRFEGTDQDLEFPFRQTTTLGVGGTVKSLETIPEACFP